MKTLGIIVGVIAAVLGIYAIVTKIFQAVWNWVAVAVFHFPHITFWQAFGIIILLSFIGSAVRFGNAK